MGTVSGAELLARALQAAHSHGVLHRSLSPWSVLIRPLGEHSEKVEPDEEDEERDQPWLFEDLDEDEEVQAPRPFCRNAERRTVKACALCRLARQPEDEALCRALQFAMGCD